MARRRSGLSQHSMLSLSIARSAMSILLLLPLLVAHRHYPNYNRPRASILRRMPMFYGKRDSGLSVPTPPPHQRHPSSALFPQSALSLLSAASAGSPSSSSSSHSRSASSVANEFLGSLQRLRHPGRSALLERRRNRKTKSKQRFSTAAERGEVADGLKGEVGRGSDLSMPSVLLFKLYKEARKAGSTRGTDGTTTTHAFGNDDARPQTLGVKDWPDLSQSASDARVQRKGPATESATSQEERLKRRLQAVDWALGSYSKGLRAVSDKDSPQAPGEDRSDLILLEVEEGAGDSSDVDGLLYHDLRDKPLVKAADSGHDRFDDSDGAFVLGPLDSGI